MLSAPTLLPMRFSSCCVIFMPRPVPSTELLRFSSIRSNARNSFGISSSLMPMPESDTRTLRAIFPGFPSGCSRPTHSFTKPLSVYLMLFVRRFSRTCLMRTTSPFKDTGISGSSSKIISSPLSCALLFTSTYRSANSSLVS